MCLMLDEGRNRLMINREIWQVINTIKGQMFQHVGDTMMEVWVHLRAIKALMPSELSYDCGDRAYLTDCDALGHLNALREHDMFDGKNSVIASVGYPCGCVATWDVVLGATFGKCDGCFTGEHAINTWELLRQTTHNEICQHQGMAEAKIEHKQNMFVNELTRDVKFD